jgi:hypothetical protein
VLNGKKRITHKSGYKDRLFELFDDWQSFMRKAVPVYIEKKETYNLEEAIWMYIVALEGETYESSFMSYCTALESVKDSYLFHNKEKFKLNPNQQKKLRRILDIAIKGFGNENGIDSDIVNNIIDKISDIHNPSFKSILAKLFSQLSVVLSDLEPDKIFNFIPIRNELFHKGKISEKDGHQLILEKDRLRILIERILLRLLEHPARPEYAVSDQPLDERYFTKDRFIT